MPHQRPCLCINDFLSPTAGTQTEAAQPSTSHAAGTQAAAEAVSAEAQTTPPSPVAAAVQAELRLEVSEAGSQADRPNMASTGSQTAAAAAAAAGAAAGNADELPLLDETGKQGAWLSSIPCQTTLACYNSSSSCPHASAASSTSTPLTARLACCLAVCFHRQQHLGVRLWATLLLLTTTHGQALCFPAD